MTAICSPFADAVASVVPVGAAFVAVGAVVPPAGTAAGAVPASGTSFAGPCGALPTAVGGPLCCEAACGPNIVGRPFARCQFSYSMNSETEKMTQRMMRRVSIETLFEREVSPRTGAREAEGRRRSGVGRQSCRRPSPAGTGSWPPGCHGWQRAIRASGEPQPASGPCMRIASAA